MRKKMQSLALALVMCLSLIPCAFAAETVSASDKFTDVPANAWYLDELNYALANGYISGTSATTFLPSTEISRAQFVTIMGRMLGAPTFGGSTKFTDVDAKSWYAPYIAWAAENGYVNGTSSSKFSPEALITVEQIAVIISNYITKSGVELSGYTASTDYKDASSISSWAVSSMETMRQYGLLHIDANGNVNPRKAASRAEGAFTLVKFAKAAGLGEEPIITQKPATSAGYDELMRRANELKTAASNVAVQAHDEFWASGKITSSMTQKQKARVYYDWLIQHCTYGSNAPVFEVPEIDWAGILRIGMDEYLAATDAEYALDTKQTAYGALVSGKAVCEGYADAYRLLLSMEGIECDIVVGNGGDHAWNKAVLDGTLYHIDATWGDTEGYDPNKYFCMTEEAAWARFGGKPTQGQADSNTIIEWSGDDIDWSGFGTGDFDWSQVTNKLFGD